MPETVSAPRLAVPASPHPHDARLQALSHHARNRVPDPVPGLSCRHRCRSGDPGLARFHGSTVAAGMMRTSGEPHSAAGLASMALPRSGWLRKRRQITRRRLLYPRASRPACWAFSRISAVPCRTDSAVLRNARLCSTATPIVPGRRRGRARNSELVSGSLPPIFARCHLIRPSSLSHASPVPGPPRSPARRRTGCRRSSWPGSRHENPGRS